MKRLFSILVLISVVMFSNMGWSGGKISSDPTKTIPVSGDFIPIIDSIDGLNKKITLGSIFLLNSAPTTGTYSAVTTFSGTAGEDLVLGDIVYLKAADGRWWKAKADAEATMPSRGVAAATINTAASGVIMQKGFMALDAWSAQVVGATVYVSAGTAGAPTTTAPATSTNIDQLVGWAMAAKVIFFDFATAVAPVVP
jgi:hypothetical protein